MPNESKPLIKPFNPLDKRNLGDSVADALLETKAQSLPPEPFIGAGVYALYYTGPFPAYRQLSEARVAENCFPDCGAYLRSAFYMICEGNVLVMSIL